MPQHDQLRRRAIDQVPVPPAESEHPALKEEGKREFLQYMAEHWDGSRSQGRAAMLAGVRMARLGSGGTFLMRLRSATRKNPETAYASESFSFADPRVDID